ncbi:hypothetical protein HRI_001278900 [Hibiscus trionum]|uniref:NAB domain-containing protein n=1 Tax=Hibiscus trionum TaxID=183268 RepID=A0A9W7HET1_HIBTR|nr:hypothetical protein HRI_001278900 [Hibiscus trionum]
MATVKRSDSKGMYSWWWNSHISPKNSKWLQENLTDMDVKVKQMIKLIEEDADSFARRAEMYYKKRPELMKLVEEFYRVYRALAERYDHATGVLRQAHQSMAEAFPNQVPMVFADDAPGGTAAEVIFAEESESSVLRKDLKQFTDLFGSEEAPNHVKFVEGRVREGLDFNDIEEKEQSLQNDVDSDLRVRVPSEPEQTSEAEVEIITLKNTLARLEAEKEAGLLEYQQSLERLSALQGEVSRAQEDSREINERASKAEAEVQTLKDALTELGAEREANLVQYQQRLEKTNNLENNLSQALKEAAELNERASEAEVKAQALNKDLARVEAEKEDSIAQYKQCSEMISNLEEKLLNAEECARRMTERAEKAETELETLKQVVVELTKDKEAAALRYRQCLESISSLEMKLACAQEETQRLNSEIDDGAAKLKGAEERCSLLDRTNQSLHAELESMVQKMGDQNQELTEKREELGRLWTSIQEEHLRFLEAETAFQTLQHLHSQSQEELRAMAAEIQNRAQILEDIETRKRGLEDELQRVKEENKGLNELNLSSAMSIKNLQDEILSLRETIAELSAEVELRVDQRNALQQEIYCLKEKLNEFNKRYQDMTGQLGSVCLNPENFASSVKELQEENTKLKDVHIRDSDEKLALLEKFKLMEELNEKNALLENSLSDLIIELEGVRARVKTLEESCESLMKEKSILVVEKDTLISQLQIAAQNLEKISEKNNFMENSLFDSNAELEELRVKLSSLENSCMLLGDEKSVLLTQREGLISQLDVSQKRLEDLEKIYQGIEEKNVGLEKEKESTLREVAELQKESQIRSLQQESLYWKKEHEEELHKALNTQVEIFILQKCAQDLEQKNLSLLLECRKLLEANIVSKKFISELETGNSVNQTVIKSVCDQISMLRLGLYQMMRTLEIDAIHGNDDKSKEDQSVLDCVFGRLQEMQNTLPKYLDENQQLVIENSVLITLLGQLKLEAENLVTEKNSLHQELRLKSEQFFELHNRTEELNEGGQREEVLHTKLGSVHENLSDNLDKLKCINNDLEGKVREMERKIEKLENALLEAEQMLRASQEERGRLHKVVEDLTTRYEEVMLSGEDRKDQILKLSGDYDQQITETESIHNVDQKFEAELLELNEEIEERKHREESPSVELKKGRNEAELWETQAAAFFCELQTSAVREALLEQKAHEISNECQILESRSNSKAMRVEELENSVRILEHENEGLEARLAAYNRAIVSLLESVTSLESRALLHPKLSSGYNQEVKDTDSGADLHAENCQQISEDQIASVPHGFSDLQGIHLRIKAIEKAVVEMERLAMLENINLNSKLETAKRQVEELRSGSSSLQESFRAKRRVNARQEGREVSHGLGSNVKMQRPTTEISEEENEKMTKDIMLDQISECSSYGLCRRETEEVDHQMLEAWETIEHDGSADSKIGKAQNMVTAPTDYKQIGSVKGHRSKNPSTESLVKELVVDKEGSKRFTKLNQEGSKRKILERLGSDAQKLANLHITVQDLKKKVDISETGKKGKGIEYRTVKEQLEEAEEAIMKLGDANRKLMTEVEDGSWYPDGKSALESDDSGSVTKQGVPEQAQRGFEKIGHLQLEVQKIQFLLLQLDDGKDSRGRTRVAESKTRVLLRDYLYGGVRNIQKTKKAPFCACLQPSTKGD